MRFWLLAGSSVLVGGTFAYVGWQLGMRWLLDRVGVEGDAAPLKEPASRVTGFDPALRERTARRRQAAEKMRTKAAHVETGAPVADVLKLVRK